MAETNREAEQLIKGSPEQLQLCIKLALLEREWAAIVGEELARRSCPAGCALSGGVAVMTLQAQDSATAASMNFGRTRLQRILSGYLSLPKLRLEIKVGKISRSTSAKPPAPAWQRRAPVRVGTEEMERELEFISAFIDDEQLAETLARLKVLTQKRNKRK